MWPFVNYACPKLELVAGFLPEYLRRIALTIVEPFQFGCALIFSCLPVGLGFEIALLRNVGVYLQSLLGYLHYEGL